MKFKPLHKFEKYFIGLQMKLLIAYMLLKHKKDYIGHDGWFYFFNFIELLLELCLQCFLQNFLIKQENIPLESTGGYSRVRDGEFL